MNLFNALSLFGFSLAILGVTAGLGASFALRKLIAHLKERGVIDDKYPDGGLWKC